jgi:hypothetical protein
MKTHYQTAGDTGGNPVTSPAGHFPQYLLRAFRWAVSTNWFLFLLAALLVCGSLLTSYYTEAWHWFQRSGALMVSIGAVLSTRRPLGLILEGMIDERVAAESTTIARVAALSDSAELRTCVCGFAFVAMGTMIWAYGDLLGCLLYWDSSCLS